MLSRVVLGNHILDVGAYWRHLANTIQPSMCDGVVRPHVKLLWPLVRSGVMISTCYRAINIAIGQSSTNTSITITGTCFWQTRCPSCHATSGVKALKGTQLVAWSCGIALVFGRCAFAVMRSTCSWWVTTYVGKPSAIGQPTRPTQPFILSGSINE